MIFLILDKLGNGFRCLKGFISFMCSVVKFLIRGAIILLGSFRREGVFVF